jgi:glutathione peroxidase
MPESSIHTDDLRKKEAGNMSFYDLTFNDTRGNTIRMSDFKGKVLLIVNTATKCGLAPQFLELETLYQKYKGRNFAIIGFPCNQFRNQEPESNETMVTACKLNFGVTFLLSQKIDVNGKSTHPVFAYLKRKLSGGLSGKRIKWNFTKFLITSEGKPFKRYAPTTKPLDIEKDILDLLDGTNA